MILLTSLPVRETGWFCLPFFFICTCDTFHRLINILFLFLFQFSYDLNKLFINMNTIIHISFKCNTFPSGLYVRAIPVFCESVDFQNPVDRCLHHRSRANKHNDGNFQSWIIVKAALLNFSVGIDFWLTFISKMPGNYILRVIIKWTTNCEDTSKMSVIQWTLKNVRSWCFGFLETFANEREDFCTHNLWTRHLYVYNDKKYVNKKERERHLPGYCQ